MKYEAIVVGGGAMGVSTALALLSQGLTRVVLVERDFVGNDRAASTDRTKAIRYEYAEQELYSRMVGRSIEMWQDLEKSTGKDLYVDCGVVCWARGEQSFTRRSFETVKAMGLPIRELPDDELCKLFPQFDCSQIDYATYNPEGGFLRALDCVKALEQEFRRLGGEVREQTTVTGISAIANGVKVSLSDGEALEAERVALTMGAWGAKFLPTLGLHLPLTANKQQVVYVEGLGQEFAPGNFPVFLNLDHEFYGFPLDAAGLFKASIHYPGPVIDPEVPLAPDPDYTDHVMSLIREYIPGAALGKVAQARICMYAMTPDEDFIIDRFPGTERVVVAAGFSGHGFKFAPLIGRLVSSLLLDVEPEFPLGTFSLSRFNS